MKQSVGNGEQSDSPAQYDNSGRGRKKIDCKDKIMQLRDATARFYEDSKQNCNRRKMHFETFVNGIEQMAK